MIFETLRQDLTRAEQKAFRGAADALIFEQPTPLTLSKRAIPELSHKLQDAFLAQDKACEEALSKYVNDAVTLALEALNVGSKKEGVSDTPMPEKVPQERMPETQTEAFLRISNMYILTRRATLTNSYSTWGFTPKLAGQKTKERNFEFDIDGKNCFGVVQALGGMYRAMGLDFEMGISADHPFAIVNVEGKTYLSSLYGVAEARGTFETVNGYKEYVPAHEDNLRYKKIVVWNFDEALVYELLENLEVLRQMSLNKAVENLPGTEEPGKKIAAENAAALQAASWRDIQKKLVPKLTRYFEETDDIWKKEKDNVMAELVLDLMFREILTSSMKKTSLKDLEFNDFKKQFLPVAHQYGAQINDHIMDGVPFSADIPHDVSEFSANAKEMLDAIPDKKLRDAIKAYFLVPFKQKLTEDPDRPTL